MFRTVVSINQERIGKMFSPETPLAERVRPRTLEEIIGQEHIIGQGGVLRRTIMSGSIPSIIFWGPPGVGKTTIANIIANQIKKPFHTLSAISSGVKDVREVIDKARRMGHVILFIDEIHRFNKGQQDALLGAVEKGIITLIGATTENPSFEVNSALLSRCQVYVLKSLTKDNLLDIIHHAISNDEILRKRKIEVEEYDALIQLSGGDARKILTLLELVINSDFDAEIIRVTNKAVTDAAQQKVAIYDKKGEQHYDIISAFIKAIRGSDPNAAVYWLARMIEGGEDIKFIARRMLILASEDIGNANPTALVIANNTFSAVNVIGYPEARIVLSQCAVYLACSPKSNASYVAINKAQQEVNRSGDLDVPLHIRNAPTKLMKDLGYGADYQYAHNYEGNFKAQEYLPDEVSGTKFFEPGDNPRENEMLKRLKIWWGKKYKY